MSWIGNNALKNYNILRVTGKDISMKYEQQVIEIWNELMGINTISFTKQENNLKSNSLKFQKTEQKKK